MDGFGIHSSIWTMDWTPQAAEHAVAEAAAMLDALRAREADARLQFARRHGTHLPAALLRGLDRLLAVARAAPGPVALVGGGEWDAAAGRLAAAYLVREHGFEGGAAGAWLRLACPTRMGAAGDLLAG